MFFDQLSVKLSDNHCATNRYKSFLPTCLLSDLLSMFWFLLLLLVMLVLVVDVCGCVCMRLCVTLFVWSVCRCVLLHVFFSVCVCLLLCSVCFVLDFTYLQNPYMLPLR